MGNDWASSFHKGTMEQQRIWAERDAGIRDYYESKAFARAAEEDRRRAKSADTWSAIGGLFEAFAEGMKRDEERHQARTQRLSTVNQPSSAAVAPTPVSPPPAARVRKSAAEEIGAGLAVLLFLTALAFALPLAATGFDIFLIIVTLTLAAFGARAVFTHVVWPLLVALLHFSILVLKGFAVLALCGGAVLFVAELLTGG